MNAATTGTCFKAISGEWQPEGWDGQDGRVVYFLVRVIIVTNSSWWEQKPKHVWVDEVGFPIIHKNLCMRPRYLGRFYSAIVQYTLPPIIMEVKKWVPPIVVTFQIVRHFPLNHDYGRKSSCKVFIFVRFPTSWSLHTWLRWCQYVVTRCTARRRPCGFGQSKNGWFIENCISSQ